MTEFRNAPYVVAPQLDNDAQPPQSCGHLLTLRRYLCIAPMEGADFPFVFALDRHFATYAAAESRLPECRAEYPRATVTSLFLAFDPDDPEQVEAYERLAAEGDAEMRELHQ